MWGPAPPAQQLRRQVSAEIRTVDLHNALPEIPDGSLDTNMFEPPNWSDDELNSTEGMWGEQATEGTVNRNSAMLEYEEMRRELTRLTMQRTKSTGAQPRPKSWLWKSKANNSSTARASTKRSSVATFDPEVDTVAESEPDIDEGKDEFDVGAFLRDGHFEKRTPEGRSAKRMGVVYKDLTVKGVGASMMFPKTLPQAIVGTFGPDLYKIICRYIPALHFGKKPPTRDILHNFTGSVHDGEMMLVLGRPGAGCSTFLKVIANQRESYAAVEGEVSYGGISAEEQKKHYNGEVSYNPEDDQHFASLNVWQTLRFALMNKTKKHDKEDIPVIIEALLKIFGISHTKYTQVGDEFVRGVSGGERKRVGIAETLATKSSVVCWDNSTRGLDASTALDYAKSLRVMTDISNRTTIVTLYQAGEGIYNLMDKVLLIESGRMIYQGPANQARQYFIDLGFDCPERQTTADFLTSIGDPNERRFQKGKEASTPKTVDELETAFRKSDIYKQNVGDVRQYERELRESGDSATREFREAVHESKSNSKLASKRSSYTVSFPRQVLACTKREFWLFWGDKTALWTKFFIIISNALIVGSLFFGENMDTSGAFSRGGVLFFGVLFLGWLQLTELMGAVSGRVVVQRHKEYAFYRPSAVSVARVILDIPVVAIQAALFGLIIYFMAGLDVKADKFFIYLFFVYLTTICVTALYRLFASLSPAIDDAVRFSGTALNLLIIYVGYVIPKPTLISEYIWFGWLYYINPISYAYEGVLTNEFSDRQMECAANDLVPPGGQAGYQTCSLTGSTPGSTSVSGATYLGLSFNYSRSNLWRNIAVLIAFTVLYILITILASELFSFVGGGGGAMIFKKTKKAQKTVQQSAKPGDVETLSEPASSSSDTIQANGEKDDIVDDIAVSKSVFTWENLEYTVPYNGGERKILNKVFGYVKPGELIALMGASGAGKTTLLNTLSQRQHIGVIEGDMLVDGHELGLEFHRGTGFCEQMDLHEGTATIREALEFSAILRQDRTVPRSEKIDYVNKIIDLLELEDIQDALICSLGVEQRKRLTIGVELAAKPNLLLFLDEPTSGLDSQSAFSIVRFLKKLSQAGQAIMCTIHQPSSMLFQQFDKVLALNPGGNQFYFGPIGENGSTLIKYFADRGTQCPPDKNVAEFLLETAVKGGARGPDGKRVNWNKEWLESQEFAEVKQEITKIKEERSKVPKNEDEVEYEFAASTATQTYMLTKRVFVAYWRDPSYLYGKLFTSIVVGIFNGFSFYNLDNSVGSLQLRLFTAFLILLIPPTIVNGVVPKFYQNRAIWQVREHPSRIYDWFAFCTAQIVAEIPMAIIGAIVYYALWYFPAGLPYDNATAGYVFFMTLLFFFFQASLGQWICSFAPDFTVISNVLPFFFVMISLFNGIVRPYSQIPVFWRYWMYWVNPSTWWINGVLAAIMGNLQVECAAGETTTFNPPPGLTCGEYANPLLQRGYIINESATSDCGFCRYRTGDEYLSTINVNASDKWRNLGVFSVFVCANWLLVYFFIYFVQVRGFTFGMGPLFRNLGRFMAFGKYIVSKPFQKKQEVQDEEK